jgi:hypothetical protein
MTRFSAHNDPLLRELNRTERKLNRWLRGSSQNAVQLVENPVSALRAADIGISEETLRDLELVINGILEKLASA